MPMHLQNYGFFFFGWPAGLAFFGVILAILVLWSLFWKALALWHAAVRGQYWWFFFILIVNSVGILEIIYLFFIAKIPPSDLFKTRR